MVCTLCTNKASANKAQCSRPLGYWGTTTVLNVHVCTLSLCSVYRCVYRNGDIKLSYYKPGKGYRKEIMKVKVTVVKIDCFIFHRFIEIFLWLSCCFTIIDNFVAIYFSESILCIYYIGNMFAAIHFCAIHLIRQICYLQTFIDNNKIDPRNIKSFTVGKNAKMSRGENL